MSDLMLLTSYTLKGKQEKVKSEEPLKQHSENIPTAHFISSQLISIYSEAQHSNGTSLLGCIVGNWSVILRHMLQFSSKGRECGRIHTLLAKSPESLVAQLKRCQLSGNILEKSLEQCYYSEEVTVGYWNWWFNST